MATLHLIMAQQHLAKKGNQKKMSLVMRVNEPEDYCNMNTNMSTSKKVCRVDGYAYMRLKMGKDDSCSRYEKIG